MAQFLHSRAAGGLGPGAVGLMGDVHPMPSGTHCGSETNGPVLKRQVVMHSKSFLMLTFQLASKLQVRTHGVYIKGVGTKLSARSRLPGMSQLFANTVKTVERPPSLVVLTSQTQRGWCQQVRNMRDRPIVRMRLIEGIISYLRKGTTSITSSTLLPQLEISL